MESLDPFRAHERDLVELHKEMRAGRGDDERADRLRDAMEWAWRQLDESQRLQLGQLSADLAMIERDEYTVPLDADVDPDDLKRNANAAYEEKTLRGSVGAISQSSQSMDAISVGAYASRGLECGRLA